MCQRSQPTRAISTKRHLLACKHGKGVLQTCVVLVAFILLSRSPATHGIRQFMRPQRVSLFKPEGHKPCVGDKPHAIIIASVPRSGSSFFLNAISASYDSFVIPEPFYEWGNGKRTSPARPSYSELLDCSYLRNSALRNLVIWDYACQNTPKLALYMSQSVTNRRRCYQRQLRNEMFEQLYADCVTSCVRVLKTVRSMEHWPNSKDFDKLRDNFHLTFVQLVRRPLHVTLSRWKQGWHTQMQNRTIEDVSKDAFRDIIIKQCSDSLTIAQQFHRLSPLVDQALFRYEDMKVDISSEVLRVLGHHVEHPITRPSVNSIVTRIRAKHFGPEREKGEEPLPTHFNITDALVEARAHTACFTFLDLFYPTP